MPVFAAHFSRLAVPWAPDTFLPASPAGWWSCPQPHSAANLPELLTWAPELEGKGSYRHGPGPQGAPWSVAKNNPKCNAWGLCQRSRTVDTSMVRGGGCRSCSEEGFLGWAWKSE